MGPAGAPVRSSQLGRAVRQTPGLEPESEHRTRLGRSAVNMATGEPGTDEPPGLGGAVSPEEQHLRDQEGNYASRLGRLAAARRDVGEEGVRGELGTISDEDLPWMAQFADDSIKGDIQAGRAYVDEHGDLFGNDVNAGDQGRTRLDIIDEWKRRSSEKLKQLLEAGSRPEDATTLAGVMVSEEGSAPPVDDHDEQQRRIYRAEKRIVPGSRRERYYLHKGKL